MKRQGEEEVKPELVQAIEYTGAVRVESIKYVDALDQRMVTVVEGLDLSVVNLETRMQGMDTAQGNLSRIQGAVVEAWSKVTNALDATDHMEVDVDSLKE